MNLSFPAQAKKRAFVDGALPYAVRVAAMAAYPPIAKGLAATLSSTRAYARATAKGVGLDPRFLVFEFVWNLFLRPKQVEIVEKLRSDALAGRSTVKQMIMGAGKTTVVAPLLALMLADGESLVVSVVPKALLEMTRARLRATFATIMCISYATSAWVLWRSACSIYRVSQDKFSA